MFLDTSSPSINRRKGNLEVGGSTSARQLFCTWHDAGDCCIRLVPCPRPAILWTWATTGVPWPSSSRLVPPSSPQYGLRESHLPPRQSITRARATMNNTSCRMLSNRNLLPSSETRQANTNGSYVPHAVDGMTNLLTFQKKCHRVRTGSACSKARGIICLVSCEFVSLSLL